MINGIALNEVLSSAASYLSPFVKAVGIFEEHNTTYRVGQALAALDGVNIVLVEFGKVCAPYIKPDEVHTKPSLARAIAGAAYAAGHIAYAVGSRNISGAGMLLVAGASIGTRHLISEPKKYYPPTSTLPSYRRNESAGSSVSVAERGSVGASGAGHTSGDTLHGRPGAPANTCQAKQMSVADAAVIGMEGRIRPRSKSLPNITEAPRGGATYPVACHSNRSMR